MHTSRIRNIHIVHCLSFFMMLSFLFDTSAFAQKHLKIGTDDWPPYEFAEEENQGIVTGYSTEVLIAVLDTMHITFDAIKIYPWARAEEMVFAGDIDALYSSSTGEKRLQYCYFPEESLIESPWVLFIRKADQGKLKFDSFEDLKGKTVGVVRAYSYTPEFWDFLNGEGRYREVAGDEQNFKMLAKNRIDYVAAEFGNGMALLRKLKIEDEIVPLLNNPIKKTGLFIMFSKETVTEEFVTQFSEQLQSFKTTEEYRTIYEKYFGAK